MEYGQFGKTIKELRKKNNLTQKEFADKLGVTYQAVSKWENGKNMPDILLLKEISKLLNVDIDELLTGEKTSKKRKKINFYFLFILVFVIIFIIIIFNNKEANFEFKKISSSCEEFTLTGSAAYNEEKTSIYISNVDYCGDDYNTVYESFDCVLYEEYKNTKTKIGSCGISNDRMTLDDFLETVQINVDDYVASCKMFASSSLYLEIQVIDNKSKTITYKVPIDLVDNCKK